MISPLGWRFFQTLRQCFDYKQRWPYLGNALKYFIACQVGVFAIFHPEKKNTVGFVTAFIIATLYQTWWDLFMDWELVVRNKDGWWQWRDKRLYSRKYIYWIICFINIALRFCWTLSFLPSHYLSGAGKLKANFGDGIGAVFAPSLGSAEIIRRTLWGFLRFELEAIKSNREDDVAYSIEHDADKEGKGIEMAPMGMVLDKSSSGPQSMSSLQTRWLQSDMSSMNDVQILGELCFYATVFALSGALMAWHRGTL
jgi:hypothetical protein